MNTERRLLKHIIFPVLFLLILSPCVDAQDMKEIRPVRLAWTGDDYTLYFEVTIEAEEKDGYRLEFQDFIYDSSIIISLPLGKYRIRVTPYDFLEKPGWESQWMNFEVKSAFVPPPPVLQAAPEPIEPRIIFVYAEEEPIEEPPPPEKKQKSFSIYLSGAWMPLVPIYGEPEPFHDNELNLVGAGARFGILYSALDYIKPGVELSGSWYNYEQNIFTAGINLVAQKDLSGYLAMRFHVGAGFTILDSKLNLNSLLGLSFLIYPHPRFFLEAGLDYVHVFTDGIPGEHPGFIRPRAGIGIQF